MAKQLKKIGENLEIKHIVIHQLLKDAGTHNVSKKVAQDLLHIGEREKLFLGSLDNSYHKKSSPIHGIFADENPKFKNFLSEFIRGEINFFEFSVKVMDHYEIILKNTAPATGGYMILCEYTNKSTSKDLLLVLMINNKEGFVVNEENLTLENIKNLDLSKVDVACLINLTDWQNVEDDLPTDRKTYLSFVKGLKEVSYYFMEFIDVNNKNTSSESTQRLINAIDAYADEKGWNRDEKIKNRNKIFEYCYQCMEEKKEILLSSISAILNPHDVFDFENFTNDDNFQVSSIISGDKTKMRNLTTIFHNAKEFRLEFDTKLLLDETITLDKKGDKLTIKNIPTTLRDKILEITKNA